MRGREEGPGGRGALETFSRSSHIRLAIETKSATKLRFVSRPRQRMHSTARCGAQQSSFSYMRNSAQRKETRTTYSFEITTLEPKPYIPSSLNNHHMMYGVDDHFVGAAELSSVSCRLRSTQ